MIQLKVDGMSVSDIMCRTGLCQSAVVANMPYQRQYPRADWSVKEKALYLHLSIHNYDEEDTLPATNQPATCRLQ